MLRQCPVCSMKDVSSRQLQPPHMQFTPEKNAKVPDTRVESEESTVWMWNWKLLLKDRAGGTKSKSKDAHCCSHIDRTGHSIEGLQGEETKMQNINKQIMKYTTKWLLSSEIVNYLSQHFLCYSTET